LKVSEAIHKAFIQVNEEGAEAAAATGIVVIKRFLLGINVDRPFMFIIIDNSSGLIMFLGKVISL